MIKVNYRYRGPFERDKFSISILSLSNEIDEKLNLLETKRKKLKDLDKNVEIISDDDYLTNELQKELYRRGIY